MWKSYFTIGGIGIMNALGSLGTTMPTADMEPTQYYTCIRIGLSEDVSEGDFKKVISHMRLWPPFSEGRESWTVERYLQPESRPAPYWAGGRNIPCQSVKPKVSYKIHIGAVDLCYINGVENLKRYLIRLLSERHPGTKIWYKLEFASAPGFVDPKPGAVIALIPR